MTQMLSINVINKSMKKTLYKKIFMRINQEML